MSENEKTVKAAAQEEAAEAKVKSRRRSSHKAEEAPAPEDPELLAKQKEEKLNALIEKGKKAGKLTSKELMDTLDDLKLEPDELDKFYDKLEDLGIDTAGEDMLPPLDDDALPAEELPGLAAYLNPKKLFLKNPSAYLTGRGPLFYTVQSEVLIQAARGFLESLGTLPGSGTYDQRDLAELEGRYDEAGVQRVVPLEDDGAFPYATVKSGSHFIQIV